jgi:hypothetical protein
VPLETEFVGVSVASVAARAQLMNEVCYNKVVDALKRGKQVMVFVHSRKETGKTGRVLAEMAARNGDTELFSTEDHPQRGLVVKDVRRSRNRELADLFDSGFGLHHAGMLRADRTLTERLFADGHIKVRVRCRCESCVCFWPARTRTTHFCKQCSFCRNQNPARHSQNPKNNATKKTKGAVLHGHARVGRQPAGAHRRH